MKTLGKHLVRVGATIPLVCAACSTTGTAVGLLEEPASKGAKADVTLIWKADGSEPRRGTIAGTLPDGTRYSGHYLQVTQTVQADAHETSWVGWAPHWSGWYGPGYEEPTHGLDWPGAIEIYTGRVNANLTSADQKLRMRCRFSVDRPREGLQGGGVGDCQLSTGEQIKDVILAPS